MGLFEGPGGACSRSSPFQVIKLLKYDEDRLQVECVNLS